MVVRKVEGSRHLLAIEGPGGVNTNSVETASVAAYLEMEISSFPYLT